MKKFYVLSLLCLASGLVSAQDVIYRCGNEYTNNVSQAKAKGCKPVDGSGVTVIHGTRASGGNAAAAPAKPKPASGSASSAPARPAATVPCRKRVTPMREPSCKAN